MRVLILGASGMLGHKLWQTFSGELDTYAGVRRSCQAYAKYDLFDPDRLVDCLNIQDFDTCIRAFGRVKPDVVINCIGIIKQVSGVTPAVDFVRVNALFPHQLAELCAVSGTRLIHFSTDCVFSGRQGRYTEEDIPDPIDTYGRSKLLGEVTGDYCLTLRTSMLGRELERSISLLEWFLNQPDQRIKGYTRAIFNGLTTCALAKIVLEVVTRWPDLTGLYHVSAPAVSKYDLLMRVREAFRVKTLIEPFDKIQVDRSLDSSRFQRQTGIVIPGWDEMIQGLVSDRTPYRDWRK